MNSKLLFLIVIGLIASVTYLTAQMQRKQTSVRKESFSLLQGEVDGHPLIAMIDMSLRDYGEKPTLPFFLSVGTRLANPTKDGFPTNTEADDLNAWEDTIDARLRPRGNIVFVGRVTSNGERELLYYVDRRDPFVATLRSLSESHSTRPFAFRCERDDKWTKADFWLKRR